MSNNDHGLVRCNEKDHKTLLIFRKGINDSNGQLSTWSTQKDCCTWEGVNCDNITDRVIELDLQAQSLKGEINLYILKLEFLSCLDLSHNEFDVIRIPFIQDNITHTSNLLYLDLSVNLYVSSLSPVDSIHMDNLTLKYLNLSGIDLHKETNWLQAVNTLPSLLELHLSYCNLNNFTINPFIEYSNLSSLVTLDLSNNNFTAQLPNWFFNLTKDLTYLDLHSSNIHGEIPSSLLNLRNLRLLYLSYNQLQGSIPDEVGNLSSLKQLYISDNNFSGEISEKTFFKLSNLDSLDLSSSNFVFQFDLDWVPPFQLHNLILGNTNQGPNFPSWIYTQKSLKSLDLSSSGISLVDRNKFSSLIEGISILSFSNNSIAEDISNLTLIGNDLRLDHNNFIGRLPNILPEVIYIDLSYNFFSGSIPNSWKNLKDLYYINLWSNKLSGEVLVHLSDFKQLQAMNLGENKFSGTIPINMSQNLKVVILRDNQFEGTIPPQLFNLPYLFHFDLAHNKLSGSIPECVYNLTNMVTIHEQSWVDTPIELFTKGQQYYVYGTNPYRRTIDLSSNNLSGDVPLELFRLVQLQTLNLSHNNLNGTISNSIGGMKNMESLDLSNNKLCGEIPQSITLLNFLGYLNLSYNS